MLQDDIVFTFFFCYQPYFFVRLEQREFSNERGRVERRAQFHKSRTRQMFVEAMTAYLDWITQAGFVVESVPGFNLCLKVF